MLNKSISKSEKVAQLPIEGQLLFTWIIPYTDVEGRIEADVWTIKGVAPYIKEIMPNNIPLLLQKMADVGLIEYYGKEHKYLQIKEFHKYQKVRTDQESPSTVPAPFQKRGKNVVKTGQQPLKVSKVKESKGKDIPPSLEALKKYITEKGYSVDPDRFHNYYESNGWKVGRNPMKSWRAALANWNKETRGKKKYAVVG